MGVRGKTMCVWAGIVVLSVSGMSHGWAQHPSAGGRPAAQMSAKDMAAKMKQKLNLSDEQTSKIEGIIQNEINEVATLIKTGSGEPDRSQVDEIRRKAESALADVLTTEQMAAWKQGKGKEPQGRGDNRRDGKDQKADSGALPMGEPIQKTSGGSGIW